MKRSLAAILVACAFANAAQADETRARWMKAAYFSEEDAVAAAPPPLAVPRAPVAQAPIAPPVMPPHRSEQLAADPTPAPRPDPLTVDPAPSPRSDQLAVDPAPSPPASEPQQPAPAQPVPPPVVVIPAEEPLLTMTRENVVAIGVGVLGGLVLLDGVVGVPAVAAAFVGGLAGQWWYSTYQAPDAEYRVNRRATGKQWRAAADRDGAINTERWLKPVRIGASTF